jgi:hypothetical protein
MKEFNELDNAVDRIDWTLLYNQKLSLLYAIDTLKNLKQEQYTEHLEGIINLLDNLQDAAEADEVWEYPEEEYNGN